MSIFSGIGHALSGGFNFAKGIVNQWGKNISGVVGLGGKATNAAGTVVDSAGQAAQGVAQGISGIGEFLKNPTTLYIIAGVAVIILLKK